MMEDERTCCVPRRPCFEDWPNSLCRCSQGDTNADDCTHLLGGGTWRDCTSGMLALAPMWQEATELWNRRVGAEKEREVLRRLGEWLEDQARQARREEAMAIGGVLASVLGHMAKLERELLGETHEEK